MFDFLTVKEPIRKTKKFCVMVGTNCIKRYAGKQAAINKAKAFRNGAKVVQLKGGRRITVYSPSKRSNRTRTMSRKRRSVKRTSRRRY